MAEGLIESNESDINQIARAELAADPADLAARWQDYFLSDGMYTRSPTGGVGVLRLLTSADIATFEAFDFDLDLIAALTPAAGKFLVARDPGGGAAWTNDLILTTDIPDISATYQPRDADLDAIAALTRADGKFIVSRSGVWAVDTLLAADIPSLAATTITSGQLALARGGTGVDLSAGGSSTAFLAQDASHVVSARAIAGADLPIGSSVQAWDADLDALAALTGTGVPKRTSANTWFLGGGDLFLSASGGTPSLTNGCAPSAKWETPTNKQDVWTLDFDAAAIEYAQWLVWMPSAWDGLTVTYAVQWTAASGSGDAVFTLDARSYANDDALDQAWGTGVDVTDTLTAALDVDITPTSSAVTIAGSPAASRPTIFRLSRKATDGGDTLAVDARVLGVKVFFGVA